MQPELEIQSHSQSEHYRTPAKRFENQVALVAGGAQGIGRAIALRLAREGAHIVIADIDREKMATTTGEISAEGADVESVACDVRDSGQVDRMVEHLIERHKRIDVLMYVAGVCKGVPFTETDEELWDFTLDTNLKGAFLVSRAVVPHMIQRRSGNLVFMASTNSWEGETLQAPYNASKAGVFLLAKTLARELGRHGIRSNALGPGFIRTRLSEPFLQDTEFIAKYCSGNGNNAIPLGRLGIPEDVAGPAAFLASSDASFVNGVLLFVDGGQLA